MDGLNAFTDKTANVHFTGVSCLAKTATCVVAGDDGGEAMVQSEVSGTWEKLHDITSGTGNGDGWEALHIACPQPGMCTVVGIEPTTYSNPAALFAVQQYDGSWGSATGVGADGTTYGGFVDGQLSCLSVGNCIWAGANGDGYERAIFAKDLGEKWGAGFINSPLPSDAEKTNLPVSESLGVGCFQDVCHAVGYYNNTDSDDLPYSFPITLVPTYKCVVPNVVGKTLSAAKDALTKAHCALGNVTKKTSAKPVGTVLSQNPKPGKHLPAGSAVAVVIAKH